MTDYSPALAQRVKEWADTNQYHYQFNQEDGMLNMTFNAASQIRSVDLKVYITQDSIESFGYLSINADANNKQNMLAVSEYFNRANYGLRLGNFELDFRDGEVRYRSMLLCGDGVPPMKLVNDVILMPLWMWEKFGNGFVKVAMAGVDPAQAADEAWSAWNNEK